MVKTILFLSLTFYFSLASAEISWENPAVLCPEEVMPRGFHCPDFSSVSDPYSEFPSTLSIEEINEWNTIRLADLRLCRNEEILRREKEKPGTFSENSLKSAWLVVDGGANVKEKLDEIEKAGREFGIPPQILIGALKQESQLSSIGVQPDGGNYSCGIAQLNISEWCESMNSLPVEDQKKLGWSSISCDTAVLPTESVKYFYELALKKTTGIKPGYQMTAEDYAWIKPTDVPLKEEVFTAVSSYLMHCQDFTLSIPFKARILKNLYDHFVPASLKLNEHYTEGKTFSRVCHNPYPVDVFPLHTGWLLTTAMYNAGPVQAKLVGHYFKVQNNQFPQMSPQDLIEALHWGGKWKEGTEQIVFADQKGKEFSQKWLKSCIVQRHVARIVQHVTEPTKIMARSLDQEGCKSTVPLYRQQSSGVKEIPE